MSKAIFLSRDKAGLLVIDVQDKLLNKMQGSGEIIKPLTTLIQGFQILSLPIVLSEQYPKGLGKTIDQIEQYFASPIDIPSLRVEKTTFSCFGNATLREKLLKQPIKQWILAGIETHVCVLQTAKDLVHLNQPVAIAIDACTSRNSLHHKLAVEEMRSLGIRICCTETILFELLKDSKSPEFKKISSLIV